MKKILITIVFAAMTFAGIANSFTTEVLPPQTNLSSALTIQEEYQLDMGSPLDMSNAGESKWVRLEFERSLSGDKLLWLDQPWLDQAWIYTYDRKGALLDSSYCGYDLPISQRVLENQHHIAELQEGTQKVLIKLLSCESIFVNIRVDSLSQVVRSQSRLDAMFGSYLGLILLSMIYAGLMYYVFRIRALIYYLFYIISVALAQSVVFGYDNIWFFYGSEHSVETTALIVPWTTITGRAVVQSIFGLTRKHHKILYLFDLSVLLGLSAFVLRINDFNYLAVLFTNISSAIFGITFIVHSLSYKNEFPGFIKTFIWALTAFLIGVTIFVFKNLGVLPTNIVTQFSMTIGSGIETILIAVSLFQKVLLTERQRKFEFIERLKLISKSAKDAEKIISLELKVRSYMYKAIMNALNPHFLFNALNSVYRCVQLEDSMTAQQYLTHLCAIMRIVLQNSEFETVPIEHEVSFLEKYMSLEKIRKKDMLEYSLNVDPSIDAKSTFIPTGIIQPILENAIIHGVSQTKAGFSHVTMLIERVDDDLLIKVSDTGIGYHESIKRKANKVRTHKSFAMKLIRRRLALDHDESISNIHIESGKVNGTIVTIKIPFPEPGNYTQFQADYN